MAKFTCLVDVDIRFEFTHDNGHIEHKNQLVKEFAMLIYNHLFFSHIIWFLIALKGYQLPYQLRLFPRSAHDIVPLILQLNKIGLFFV